MEYYVCCVSENFVDFPCLCSNYALKYNDTKMFKLRMQIMHISKRVVICGAHALCRIITKHSTFYNGEPKGQGYHFIKDIDIR